MDYLVLLTATAWLFFKGTDGLGTHDWWGRTKLSVE